MSLIFIIFYGGFGTNWRAARPVAVQSILLSTLGVLLTALLTGVFCRFILRFDWLESLLIGAVLGSTDATSVFSIMRSKNLSLKYNTASMLELESGSNDPCAYMMTYLLLALMGGGITAILSAMAYQDERHIQLCETAVAGHPEWQEKHVSEINWDGSLVILIRRGENTILPTGGVRLADGDVVVLANMKIDRYSTTC